MSLPIIQLGPGGVRLANAPLSIALVGNPNSGKSSLFNALTGLRTKTANYPGITVDIRKAKLSLSSKTSKTLNSQANKHPDAPEGKPIELVDLPGMYSLDGLSPEEKIAVDYLQSADGPSAVLVVLDATNLVRNLYLASEVIELGLPTLVAVTMIDTARAAGVEVHADKLAQKLDRPLVLVSSRTGEGLDQLKASLCGLLSPTTQKQAPIKSCTFGCTGCVYAARHAWAEETGQSSVNRPVERSAQAERIDRVLTHPIAGLIAFLAVMLGVFFMIFSLAGFPMAAIESLFAWAGGAAEQIIPDQPVASWIWQPIVAALSMGVFTGGYQLAKIAWTKKTLAIATLVSLAVSFLPIDDFRSLVVDGVIGGVAGVVVFLPQICILFFFIALLEDSGYMARAAFVMERVMRVVGLPGKAFVPMLSAHACAIPGIMATRTIDSWRDRLVTILVLPLLTCSARLPVYTMVAALLFGDQPWKAALVFAGAYLLGLIAALGAAFALRKTLIPGTAAPLVIELPAYRWPSAKNLFISVTERAFGFLRNAGSIILVISVALWALATYPKLSESQIQELSSRSQPIDQVGVSNDAISAPMRPEPSSEVSNPEWDSMLQQAALKNSFAGRTGRLVEPVFNPLGFDWKINVGVLSSFAAREVVVSTLSIMYGLGEEGGEEVSTLTETLKSQRNEDGSRVFTVANSMSLLVFFVLAMQCLPTQAVTKRETGSWRWALFQLAYMSLLAYISAMATFQVLSYLGYHT